MRLGLYLYELGDVYMRTEDICMLTGLYFDKNWGIFMRTGFILEADLYEDCGCA